MTAPSNNHHDSMTISLPRQTTAGQEVVTVSLKPPSIVSLASALNRLLRCTHPAHRNRQVFTRWLNQHWASPPPEKNFLDTLSITTLEKLTQQWLRQSFSKNDEETSRLNTQLHQHFFNEDLSTTQWVAWATDDLLQLKSHRHPDHHPAHYHWPQNISDTSHTHLAKILSDHGYQPNLLKNNNDSPKQTAKQLAHCYLHTRIMQHVFPWANCFRALLQHTEQATHNSNPSQPESSAQAQAQWQSHYPHLRHGLDVYKTFINTTRTHSLAHSPSLELTAIRPVNHWLFVEGITENILLPTWAQQLNVPFHQSGAAIIEAGGKKPMLNKIKALKSYFSGRITILLDKDAEPDRLEFESLLDANDTLHILEEGTIEDTYSDSLLLKVINTHYHPVITLTQSDLDQLKETQQETQLKPHQTNNNIQRLKTLFLDYELESNASKPTQGFDKVSFARHVLEVTAQHPELIPNSIQDLIQNQVTQNKQN